MSSSKSGPYAMSITFEADWCYSKNTESLINNLGKGKAATDFAGCRECSICLGSVLVG
jgi:hypothetical protein